MSERQQDWNGLTKTDYIYWVIVCAFAELIGISIGAVWWIAADRFDPEPLTAAAKWAALALKSMSGIAEGVILGSLQVLALRRIYPHVSAKRWIIYTTSLAVAGWAIGSAFPIFSEQSATPSEAFDPPLALLALASAAMGTVLGTLFGLVQRQELKHVAKDTRWWIFGNAFGWALALPIIYVAASIGNPEAPLRVFIVSGLVAGLLAGVILGAVTGLSFLKMKPIR